MRRGDTAVPDPHDDATTAPPEAALGQEQSHQTVLPKYWQIILIALVAIAFTAVWLGVYGFLNQAIWSNSFVTAHRWTIPVVVVLFSALVGLTVKYLRAPTVINGGVMESLKGGKNRQVDYTTFPGALLSSFLSVLSGASVGPEGPLGFLVQDIAAWIHKKLRLTRETWLGFEAAALASMYNGIIGSPLFTGVLATEYKVGEDSGLVYLAWNLLAGVVGYLFYTLLGLNDFAQYIPFTPTSRLTLSYAPYAVLLSIVGCLVALFIALAMRVFERLMERVFAERVVLRVLVAGVIIAVIVYLVPEVMFAGETQIFPMVNHPASYGVAVLVGLGILKLLLLALSFKAGFLGGPTFPMLFGCTMFGLALSLLFPSVPVSILILCIEVGALTLASGAPLTMILLVAVIGTADSFTIALLVLSSVIALIVGAGIKQMQVQRSSQQAAIESRPAQGTS
jgi:H+/Cl- antiporter ClcA